MNRQSRSNWWGLSALVLCVGLVGCHTTDDARVIQVLNQRGFGRPTLDANRQFYIGIGDGLILRAPSYPEYNGVSEKVRMDGVITLPDVGEVYLNGLTPTEATETVRLRYQEWVNDTAGFRMEITDITSKRYYVVRVDPQRPVSMTFQGDELLIDALRKANYDPLLTDTSDIKVIRGDPENPLVIHCDLDDILERGLTRDNIQIRENDIVFLTPSWVGHMTLFVKKLASPIKPLTDLITSANNMVSIGSSFGEETAGVKGFGGNNFGN